MYTLLQKLKELELAMARLTAVSNKGQTLNEQMKGSFAEAMTKAASYPAAAPPPSKGLSYAMPQSKGGR